MYTAVRSSYALNGRNTTPKQRMSTEGNKELFLALLSAGIRLLP